MMRASPLLSPVIPHSDAYWRTMRYFNFYRLLIAGILFSAYFLLNERTWWQSYDTALYFYGSVGYFVFGVIMAGLAIARWPRFNRQLTLQAIGDIGFIVMLLHASGGVKSGLGLLLVVAIAGSSLLSQGRLALFYAALASIALLLEQTWQMFATAERYDDYTHAVMLSLGCFATAWIAHSFARRTQQSEELASRRGIDLENLAQVNQLVIRDMQDGVLVIDEGMRVRHHNARAELLLGLDPVLQSAPLHRFSPDIAELYTDWAHGNGGQNGLGEYRFSVSGRELLLRFLPVATIRSQGAVIFIEDWTRIQEQARYLKLAALGRLTANIAHEIRNPLSAIGHANQLLQEEDEVDPTARRLLQIIDDNVARLDHMVQDVLQLSRRDRVQQASVELDTFLQEFHEQFCQVEKLEASDFVLEIAAPGMHVLFDQHHLHQVLWNLCRNGWRHGRKQHGSLHLRLQENARRSGLELQVTDDGPGIPAEVRAHLFEPFFTTEVDGTGLGLYVARELCEANGASLDYLEAPAGAKFSIYLKKHDEQSE